MVTARSCENAYAVHFRHEHFVKLAFYSTVSKLGFGCMVLLEVRHLSAHCR